ncbi:MAG: 50S ribosomal protein L18 [candidate division WOR-3 bacterium]
MAGTKKLEPRIKRKQRIRKKISGTPERPRLCVYRSLNHIYAQLIDDEKGHTICSASTLEKSLSADLKSLKSKEAAQIIGKTIAERALKLGVEKVVFDRNGYLYHGRVKVLADAAREAGLKF